MSATLQAKGVAAGHGERELFTGLDLVVAQGDVIGLIVYTMDVSAAESSPYRLLFGAKQGRRENATRRADLSRVSGTDLELTHGR